MITVFFLTLNGCLIKTLSQKAFSHWGLVSCNSLRVCCERRSSLPLTPRPCIASPHLLPPIVLWGSSHFDTTQLLTRGCRAHRMMSSSPKPPSPQARSREILVSPAKSAFLSSQLPSSHVPPQTWLEDGTARRTNETKALGDAPQVPISFHPRFRRVVTRHYPKSEPPPYAAFWR